MSKLLRQRILDNAVRGIVALLGGSAIVSLSLVTIYYTPIWFIAGTWSLLALGTLWSFWDRITRIAGVAIKSHDVSFNGGFHRSPVDTEGTRTFTTWMTESIQWFVGERTTPLPLRQLLWERDQLILRLNKLELQLAAKADISAMPSAKELGDSIQDRLKETEAKLLEAVTQVAAEAAERDWPSAPPPDLAPATPPARQPAPPAPAPQPSTPVAKSKKTRKEKKKDKPDATPAQAPRQPETVPVADATKPQESESPEVLCYLCREPAVGKLDTNSEPVCKRHLAEYQALVQEEEAKAPQPEQPEPVA
jgi:hypothetical protein